MAKVDEILNLIQRNEIRKACVVDPTRAAKIQERLVQIALDAGATEVEVAAALHGEW